MKSCHNRRFSPGDIRLFPNKRPNNVYFGISRFEGHCQIIDLAHFSSQPTNRAILDSKSVQGQKRESQELFILPCKLELISDENRHNFCPPQIASNHNFLNKKLRNATTEYKREWGNCWRRSLISKIFCKFRIHARARL